MYERDKGICQICNKIVSRKRFTIDHIIPKSVGGLKELKNLQLAHKSCNILKGNYNGLFKVVMVPFHKITPSMLEAYRQKTEVLIAPIETSKLEIELL